MAASALGREAHRLWVAGLLAQALAAPFLGAQPAPAPASEDPTQVERAAAPKAREVAPEQELTQSTGPLATPDVLPCLFPLLERSRYGASDRESAAWLVASDDEGAGTDCLPWPEADATGVARWKGPRPPRVLALVHTHPTRSTKGRSWGSQPSPQDCRTARQLGVPVVVVTPAEVTLCTPDRGRIVRLLGAEWLERKAPAREAALR